MTPFQTSMLLCGLLAAGVAVLGLATWLLHKLADWLLEDWGPDD